MTNLARTVARGYGAAHKRRRAHWQARLDAGEQIGCYRCGKPVDPTRWDLGHEDDRSDWTGPEHVECNRAAGGRNGAAATNAKQQMIIREW